MRRHCEERISPAGLEKRLPSPLDGQSQDYSRVYDQRTPGCDVVYHPVFFVMLGIRFETAAVFKRKDGCCCQIFPGCHVGQESSCVIVGPAGKGLEDVAVVQE